MKSSRRYRRFVNQKRRLARPFVKILIALLVFIGIFIFIKMNTRYWNGEDKIGIVNQKENGDAEVTLVDPKLDEIVSLTVPGNTEVEVAKNLGTMRLKNVWQLGINEGVGGNLVAQTVTRNFLFPVFLWRDIKGKTNIPLGDRVYLKLFDLKTKNPERTEIDLGKSQFLKRELLKDGEIGFRLYGEMSERLTAYFADDDFAGKDVKIYIKDATGSFGVAQRLGRIVEVVGGKVVTIEKLPLEDSDCTVLGKDKKIVSKISKLFSCKAGRGNTDYDLEIRLGKGFAARF